MLNVYETIVELIGVLPPELNWVYGLSTCLFIFFLLYLIFIPFIYVMTWRR